MPARYRPRLRCLPLASSASSTGEQQVELGEKRRIRLLPILTVGPSALCRAGRRLALGVYADSTQTSLFSTSGPPFPLFARIVLLLLLSPFTSTQTASYASRCPLQLLSAPTAALGCLSSTRAHFSHQLLNDGKEAVAAQERRRSHVGQGTSLLGRSGRRKTSLRGREDGPRIGGPDILVERWRASSVCLAH